MKHLNLALLILLIAIGNVCLAQESSSYFLVENVDTNSLSQKDKAILRKHLQAFHESTNDTASISEIVTMANNISHAGLQADYTHWISENIDAKLGLAENKNSKNIWLKLKATAISNQGVCFIRNGELNVGMDMLFSSLDIKKEIGDTLLIADGYSDIGALYFNNKYYEEALAYWHDALTLQKKAHEWSGAAKTLSYISAVHLKKGEFEAARKDVAEGIELAKNGDDELKEASLYERMAGIDGATGNYTEALVNYKRSLAVYKAYEQYARMAAMHVKISSFYRLQKKYEAALKHAKQGLKLAEEYNYLRGRMNALHLIYLISTEQQKYKQALEYYTQYRNLNDSIYNNKNDKILLVKEAEFKIREDSIKTAEALKLQQVELNLERKKADNRSNLLWVSLFGIALLAVAIFIIVKRFDVTRKQNQIIAEEKRKSDEANAQLQELNKSRTRFFGNISHEFRTPLTVIGGMAGQIEENPEKWAEKGAGMIKRNSKSLLQMVNQILSLQKMETGALKPNMILGDVVSFSRYLFQSFTSYAEEKNISFVFNTFADEFDMDFDPDKLQSILTNLISNGLKYNVEGGSFTLELTKKNEQLQIVVIDTGIGLNPEKKARVFDRFYQADATSTRPGEGMGIGLNYTAELVKLFGGSISVDSQEGKGSTFTVLLPITKNATTEGFFEVEQIQPEKTGTETKEKVDGLPNLLIIEDNNDVVEYLQTLLSENYNTEVAYDGEAGIETALEQVPDVIITDVMMPKKDGFEVVETVKNDQRTNHIPVIMLTAKADVESKLAGLSKGADAYLNKPFNKKELQLILQNFAKMQQRLQSRYATFEALPENETESEHIVEQDAFITTLNKILEAELDNSDFKVPELCVAMGISRSQLHNKLKALTSLSTSHYVTGFKIAKAKTMLKTTDLRVSEIAYALGYDNPSYFTRIFKNDTGLSPNSFRAS